MSSAGGMQAAFELGRGRRGSRGCPALIAALVISAAAQAQTFSVVVKDGDLVPGVGHVTSIDHVAINRCNRSLVVAHTDALDPSTDSVLLEDGILRSREGDPVAEPAGAHISAFDHLTLTDLGASCFLHHLEGAASGANSGIYFGANLLIAEGSVTSAPFLTAGTRYKRFLGARISDTNHIRLLAEVDDPAIPSDTDGVLISIGLDPSGHLVFEGLLAKEGELFSSLAPDRIRSFGAAPSQFATSDAIVNLSAVLCVVNLTGPSTSNVAILSGPTKLVRKGETSPFAGRIWTDVGAALDVNNMGAYVFRGTLARTSGETEVLVKTGTYKIAETGEPLSALGGQFDLVEFGTGAVRIDDEGVVIWFGRWNDPDTTRNAGLFAGEELLVQQGVSTVGGIVIESIASTQDNFEVSDDGRYVLFRGTLAGGLEAAIRVDRGETVFPFCFGDGLEPQLISCPCGNFGAPGHGCANSQVASLGAQLSGSGSPSADTLLLSASDMLPTASSIFLQGTLPVEFGAFYGDGIRCTGGQLSRLALKIASGGAAQYPEPGDPSISVRSAQIGSPIQPCETRTYQVYYRDPVLEFCPPSAGAIGASWNVTNGVYVTWP